MNNDIKEKRGDMSMTDNEVYVSYDDPLTMSEEEWSDIIRAVMKGFEECDSDFAHDLGAMLKEIKALTIQTQGFIMKLNECKDNELKGDLWRGIVISMQHLAFAVGIAAGLNDYATGELQVPPNFHFTSNDDKSR